MVKCTKHIFSISHNSHIYFPRQAIRSLATTREIADSHGDRISRLTNTKIFILCFKLARFTFSAFVTREAQCKQRNITYNSKKIETSLEKKFIKTTSFPPLPSGNSWAYDTPHPPEFPFPSVGGGGMDIFWNHTMLKIVSLVLFNQTYC